MQIDYTKFYGKTGKEVLEMLTDEERQYFIERVKDSMPPGYFETLTKEQIDYEIVMDIVCRAAAKAPEIQKAFRLNRIRTEIDDIE